MNTMKARKTLMSFLGFKSDSTEKLRIYYEEERTDNFVGPIEALFNPTELKFGHDVSWKSTPIPGSIAGGYYRLEFQNLQPVTLSVELFFDTYEGDPKAKLGLGGMAARVLPSHLWAKVSGIEVMKYTADLQKLAMIDADLHRPPRCAIHWGSNLLLQGVLTRMSEDYIHFLPDGTPVRASVNCTFQEYIPYREAIEQRSPDVHRTRVVRRGDTLSSIAQEIYNDPAQWRVIARANGITDPRGIRPGQVLAIPALTR